MFVDKSIQRVMGRFKVMGFPADEQVIREGYHQILDQIDKTDRNKSDQDLIAILTLRGMAPKVLNEKFNRIVNALNQL